MRTNHFLIYGANGYTGQLIARMAVNLKMPVILAGRNGTAIKKLANELQVPYKIFDLGDPDRLHEALSEVKLVLHAAGPFQLTARQMIEACINTGTHYIDITGEIAVFELAKHFNNAATSAGIMIMPGVGFDVVPTDCMALFLKNRLPDAVSLQLAFASLEGGLSQGTASTMIMGLGEGGASRKNGKIIREALGHKGMWLNFSEGSGEIERKLFVMSIPWGDVSTAHFTTGIPDIETYTAIAPSIYKLLKMQWTFNWFLRTPLIRKFVAKKINKRSPGPSDEKRAKGKSMIWGQAKNKAGKKVMATMSTKDGYTLTAQSSLLVAQKILSGHYKAGYQTPAAAYSEDFILELDGTKRTLAIYR